MTRWKDGGRREEGGRGRGGREEKKGVGFAESAGGFVSFVGRARGGERGGEGAGKEGVEGGLLRVRRSGGRS